MRYILLSIVWFFFVALPVHAQPYDGCDRTQSDAILHALRSAKDLTLKAAVAVDDTQEYARWFGDYNRQNAEAVRSNLKSIVTAIRSGRVTVRCEPSSEETCREGAYAWVFANDPYLTHLCPSFFNLPSLAALQPGVRHSNNGTREGTIVHELSHFTNVAATEDHCYSRSECSDMAQRNARRAIDNADSYQYYTEDVTYYAGQPIAGKPPPAQRINR